MKDCKDCSLNTICTYYDKEQKRTKGKCPGWRWFKRCWITSLVLALLLGGCSPGRHSGHIYMREPNHIEVVFDRPMSMTYEKDGVKVEASSLKPGLLEDIIKVLLLRPR